MRFKVGQVYENIDDGRSAVVAEIRNSGRVGLQRLTDTTLKNGSCGPSSNGLEGGGERQGQDNGRAKARPTKIMPNGPGLCRGNECPDQAEMPTGWYVGTSRAAKKWGSAVSARISFELESFSPIPRRICNASPATLA